MKSVFDKPVSMWSKVVEFFSGKKTYICAVILFCLGGAYALGWIDQEHFQYLSAMIVSLGGMAARSAIAKLEK